MFVVQKKTVPLHPQFRCSSWESKRLRRHRFASDDWGMV